MTHPLINGMKNTVFKKLVHIMTLSALFLIIGTVMINARGSDSQATPESQQNKTRITGTVVDRNGEPVIGANVVEKSVTVNGTITDADGKFSLNISPGTTLVVSYIGYVTQEVTVDNRTALIITMAEDTKALEEVVVVGYGTQKKSDLTGAISSIKADDIRERPAANIVDKMQGKAAGVDIAMSSGAPGAVPTIRIRGRRSFSASNDPLYVVDGIPFQQGSLNDLNPNEIESIEILKDAASSAIYGSRAANGVILITTRRGKAGKSQIIYNGYYGTTQVSKMPDMMNGEEYAEMRREAYRAANNYTDDEHCFDVNQLRNLRNGVWYDYPDLIFSNGYKTDHQLSLSGGNRQTQFALSGGYLDEQGTIKTMYYKRYNMRINIDHQMYNWLTVGTSTSLSRSIQESGSGGDIISHALQNSPLGDCYDPETGELNFNPTSDPLFANPLFDLDGANVSNQNKINRVFSSLYAEVHFLKYFKYKLNLGVDNYDYRRGEFYGSYSTSRMGSAPTASATNSEEFNYTLENILNCNRTLGKHSLNATLMQSIQSYASEVYSMSVLGLPYETQKFYNMDSGNSVTAKASQLTEWSIASFMGRLNYSFNDRYLLQATLRADGSSRL